MILWSLLVIVIVFFDQAAKMKVAAVLGPTDAISVLPGIVDIVYVKNTGAAFSFLSAKSYGIVILSCVSVIFCLAVLWYLIRKKPKNKLLLLALAMMFSGAMGNAIDRIARGYVIDFIETKFISFPVFNIADIMITLGAGLMVIYVLFFDKEKSKDKNKPEEKENEDTDN